MVIQAAESNSCGSLFESCAAAASKAKRQKNRLTTGLTFGECAFVKKYKIEEDTVQEMLLIPLYGRKLCSKRFPTLFTDDSAARLMEKIDYDFSALEKRSDSIVQVFGALEVAMRQSDIAWEVRNYLKEHSPRGGDQPGLRAGRYRPRLRQRLVPHV